LRADATVFQSGPDGNRTEFRCGAGGQIALKATHGGAGRADDNDWVMIAISAHLSLRKGLLLSVFKLPDGFGIPYL